MLSPSLCLPPPPSSFCPQSLPPSLPRHRNKIALISGHFSSSPVLFSALITAVKTNPAPTLSPSTPASFVLSALSFEGGVGWGGVWSNQWRIAPPKAASTSWRAAAHISGYTVRHKDTWLGASSLFLQTSRFQAGGAQKAAEFLFPLAGFLSHATPWARWTHGVVFVS